MASWRRSVCARDGCGPGSTCRAGNDADHGNAGGGHGATRAGHGPSWRYVDHSGGGRVEVASILGSSRNRRGDACRRPLVDPCQLREMPLTVLVDREGGIAISHAGVVDLLAFEADVNALLAE